MMGKDVVLKAKGRSPPVQHWLDTEIDHFLRNYPVDRNLSSRYWPKSLRDLLKLIFSLLKTLDDDRLDSLYLTRESLDSLLYEVSQPTKFYLKATVKRRICSLMGMLRTRTFKWFPRKEFVPMSCVRGSWPNDLSRIPNDLQELPTSMDLRSDIEEYIFEFLKEVIPGEGYKFSFDRQNDVPIVIEVMEDKVLVVSSCLKAKSDVLTQSGEYELVPNDVILVKVLSHPGSINTVEEGLFTKDAL